MSASRVCLVLAACIPALLLSGCLATGGAAAAGFANGLSGNPQPMNGGQRATWSGSSELGVSVTGRAMVTCGYNLYGRIFYRSFLGSVCPYAIDVQ